MNTVNQILKRKQLSVISISADTTVIDALKVMSDNNIGSVVIVDENGSYLGLVTERDYSRKIVLKGKNSSDTSVTDIMTSDLPKVSLQDTVEYCMQVMTKENIRYLPVFAGSELKGIISMSDVVKETILMQQETIDHLQQYISL
jgi:CBS domain-containing protein